MCTLTVVPMRWDRLRLAFNRDERPTRPPAAPPAVRRFGDRHAVLPTDSPSGGTWLAVNDAGLTLAVLNVNPRGPGTGVRSQEEGRSHLTPDPCSRTPVRSRGDLIPALVGSDAPAAALAELERAFNYHDFAPFRLVLVGRGIVADVRWDGRAPMVASRLLGGSPVLFTSSGLGDHLVERVRRELFDELFAGPPAGWAAAQDAFHRHRWPGRDHLSVNMTRDAARTVSHAVIELDDAGATMWYTAPAFDPAGETRTALAFRPAGVP
jgi:hypothetical protein